MTMEAVGINIYGGGFTLGAQRHFNVIGQWEEHPLGRDTFTRNFGNKIFRPLKMSEWPIKKSRGVPFVFANPPCAPWSDANARIGLTKEERFRKNTMGEDYRLQLTEHTMSAAMAMMPEVFILESVNRAFDYGKRYYDEYAKKWMKLGYSVTYFLTDAIIHGSPAKRQRFHFIAHRKSLHLIPPSMKNFKPVTCKDVLWDIRNKVTSPDHWSADTLQHYEQPVNQLMRAIFPLVPPGRRMMDTIDLLGKKYKGPRRTFLIRRLVWNAPMNTMVGLEFIHPDGERLITWREGMRLLTFPDTFVAVRSIDVVDTVIPLMGRLLSKIASQSITDGDRVRKKSQEPAIVDWRPLGKKYHTHEYLKSLEAGR